MEFQAKPELIVADATPLMHLEGLKDHYQILKDILQRVYIPEAVAQELAAGYGITAEAYLLLYELQNFFQIVKTNINKQLQGILDLDPGEAVAISLAHSQKIPLLIQERDGRKVAHAHGVFYVGNAGLIRDAVKLGVISRERGITVLQDLYQNKGINQVVLENILAALGD